jgi:hypothetical protein
MAEQDSTIAENTAGAIAAVHARQPAATATIGFTSVEQANLVRASWAAEALAVFSGRTGILEEDVTTAVGDLITDLGHLLDDAGLPAGTFERILERAQAAYIEELTEF